MRAVRIYHRVDAPGELQFLTSSTYRRAPVFFSDRFRRCFVERLEEVRRELNFLLVGWVLTPEHFHLPLRPEPAETTPLIMKELKEESAKSFVEYAHKAMRKEWVKRWEGREDCRWTGQKPTLRKATDRGYGCSALLAKGIAMDVSPSVGLALRAPAS